jgi:nucleotide-binding universal stress UspA family protein
METQKIDRILIPVDFSETGLLALDHGTFMARLFKADLYLLYVVELIEFPFNLNSPVLITAKDYDEIEKAAVEKMQELAKEIRQKFAITVITKVTRGRVISAISETAKENKVDIIIMGTHGAKGFDEYFIGSNAHKTVTISPCPVITIHQHAKKIGFKKILMPIDNSLHSRQKVDMVIEMATAYGAEVYILGLINSNEEIDEKKFDIKLDSVEKVIKKAGLAYTRKVRKGENLAVAAMDYSKEINADLIVIMTDHESNLTGMFLGPFSKQIINHSRIPVMSIRPIEGKYEWTELWAASNPFAES